MIVTDAAIAESLAEMTPARCLVLAARSFYEGVEGRPCRSPYECCACATRVDTPCEICGRENFKPAKPGRRRS